LERIAVLLLLSIPVTLPIAVGLWLDAGGTLTTIMPFVPLVFIIVLGVIGLLSIDTATNDSAVTSRRVNGLLSMTPQQLEVARRIQKNMEGPEEPFHLDADPNYPRAKFDGEGRFSEN
jgi:amino acid transporter